MVNGRLPAATALPAPIPPQIPACGPPLHWNQMQGKFGSFKFYEKMRLIRVEYGQNPLPAANRDFKALR
jgi:hypothetical protein